jgi:hypothetical protein
MWTADDTFRRRAVLHRLDMLDRAAGQADPSTLLPLARTELRRMADCWRLLLTSHRADEDGRCQACDSEYHREHGRHARRGRFGLGGTRWPCQVWRCAHEQLIGEGLPHRARPNPLRNPFSVTNPGR